MYPANQYIDPYFSHQRDRAPYPCYPYLGWEAAPHRSRMDLSTGPSNFGPWPYHGSMRHSNPPEFHSCCNHTYPPGYYSFRPPFPHELPPPNLYYHGPFPRHPNAYPSYLVPPPPYAVDQAPYSYDKSKNHCCGCPNHVCHGRENNNVKIEEERPQSEQKNANDPSMVRHPNYQYPILWLPSGSMKDKENSSSSEVQPQLWNGWIPVNGKKPGDVKQQAQSEQKVKQSPWPIIWMPGYEEPQHTAKDAREFEANPKASEEAPSSPKIKVIPLPFFENDHHDQEPTAKDSFGNRNEKSAVKNQSVSSEHPEAVSMKQGNYKTIPVVQKKESDEKKPSANETKEEKKASNAEKEGENGAKHNTESSKDKHSKLPPVCLRVDPLPRKKSGNGSSRSPSPPSQKDKARAEKDNTEVRTQNRETKESNPKKGIKVVEVKEKMHDEMKKVVDYSHETVPVTSAKGSPEKEVHTSMDDQKVKGDSIGADIRENVSMKSLQSCEEMEKKEDEVKFQGGEGVKGEDRKCRINMLEADAAVRIQSVYRGYDVRRWQPLEKLRKIKNVREQMQDVKRHLQSLEASSNQPEVKEQVAVGETIMNLLLKLDTIQGLHPSVREIRKSVARELICLQERLDSLGRQASTESQYTNIEGEKSNGNEQATVSSAPVPSVEAPEQDKPTVQGEGQGSSLVDSMELRHETASSGESMENTRVSPAAVEDSTVPSIAASVQSELVPDHEESAEGQTQEPSVAQCMELKHDVASVEQEHHKEELTTLVPATAVEYTTVPAKDVESHEAPSAPADEPISFKPDVQVEETRGSSLEQQVTSAEVEDTKDTREPDRTPEAASDGTSNLEEVIVDDAENSVELPLIETASASETAIEEQAGSEESEALKCEISNQDDAALTYQQNEPAVEHPTETFTKEEEPQLLALEEEDCIVNNAPKVAQADGAMSAEPIFPECESTEVSSQNDGIAGQQKFEMQASLVNQTCIPSECNNDSNTTEEVDVPEAAECNDIPKETPACATEEHAAEVEADGPEEGVAELGDHFHAAGDASERTKLMESPEETEVLTTETDASLKTNGLKEASLVPSTPTCSLSNDEKKLAEENEKLREMLQKLLEAGKDQLGVITELSDKVKTLERKLAHKKRARVRTHRSTRHATAKVH